jgi:asparagine synthase (glutamine-hydrolysing)
MCGIVGLLNLNSAEITTAELEGVRLMGDTQRHRGPDDSGYEAIGPCALGSQRLSILDLSPHGHMPMWSEDRSIALIQNGEIYNFVELREELKALGHRFQSDGDTEVILNAYRQWGEACVERFVGMWAFALYDRAKQTLLLSRDRFGIKPLYVHQTKDRLLFASEIKAIVAYLRSAGEPVSVNEASVATYGAVGLVDGLEDTFFKGIRRFPAATNWLVGPEGVTSRQYWSLPEAAAERRESISGMSEQQVFEELNRTLSEAVRVHLRSDVPVGVCLSGGLDSSAVVGLASKTLPSVKTFTVYFGDGPDYDERQHSRPIVERFNADATEQLVEPAALLDSLKQIVWHLDEPAAALGVFPQWHVMELASKQVKVVLDGQGGDEAFAGYLNYLPQQLYGSFPTQPLRFAMDALGEARIHGNDRAKADLRSAVAMRLKAPTPPEVSTTPDAGLLHADLRPLAEVGWNEWRLWPRVFDDWLNNVLYWELTRMRLPALLRYEDRLSMAFSIESRVPFLDHRVVELAFALPGHLKVRNGWTKFALRQALTGLLPDSVTWRRDKKGFPTPVGNWLKDARGQAARNLLRDPRRKSETMFPAAQMEAAIALHESGAADRSWQLWRALSTEVWLDAFKL